MTEGLGSLKLVKMACGESTAEPGAMGNWMRHDRKRIKYPLPKTINVISKAS
jgi:hypothetical protein